MESRKISQEPQSDELQNHKNIQAELIATAERSGNIQSTENLYGPIQEVRARSCDATQIHLNYIGHGGQYCAHIFKNTCVLDSLLAGCHIAANVHPNIRELFMQDSTINAAMSLLDSRKYAEAKALWLINLDLRAGYKKHFTESEFIDIRGYIKDHLPNFVDLTSANYDHGRDSPNPEDRVYHRTVRKFVEFGHVRALGPRSDPQLILVDVDGRINGFPPLDITDAYERKFKLQFLLLGMMTADSNHMVLYTSLDEGWWLYDDMKNPLFRAVAMEDVQTLGYVVYLAAYVKLPTKNGKQD